MFAKAIARLQSGVCPLCNLELEPGAYAQACPVCVTSWAILRINDTPFLVSTRDLDDTERARLQHREEEE